MSAAVLKELRDLDDELKNYQNQLARVGLSLSMLQRSITDEAKQTTLESLRSALRGDIDTVGLDRLDAFLKFENDASLKPEQKLALAYSGWLMGSAHAITDLDQTLRYWQARHLIEQYLLTNDSAMKRELLSKMRNMEGVTPEAVSRMLVWLKPVLETPGVLPARLIKSTWKTPTPKCPSPIMCCCRTNTRPTGPIR